MDPQRFTTSRRAYRGIFGKDWSNFGDKDTFNVVEIGIQKMKPVAIIFIANRQ